MGFWDYLKGRGFSCCLCNHLHVETIFETRLTDADIFQSNRQFSEGDQITIDGLDDYAELEPPADDTNIALIHEDWDCEKCGLNYQYGLINLQLCFADNTEKERFQQKLAAGTQCELPVKATILKIKSHIPDNVNNLKGINYVADDYIDWKYLCGGEYNITKGKRIWNELSVAERKHLLIGRYKDWFNTIIESNNRKYQDISGIKPYSQSELKEYLLLVRAIGRRFGITIHYNHLQSPA